MKERVERCSNQSFFPLIHVICKYLASQYFTWQQRESTSFQERRGFFSSSTSNVIEIHVREKRRQSNRDDWSKILFLSRILYILRYWFLSSAPEIKLVKITHRVFEFARWAGEVIDSLKTIRCQTVKRANRSCVSSRTAAGNSARLSSRKSIYYFY